MHHQHVGGSVRPARACVKGRASPAGGPGQPAAAAAAGSARAPAGAGVSAFMGQRRQQNDGVQPAAHAVAQSQLAVVAVDRAAHDGQAQAGAGRARIGARTKRPKAWAGPAGCPVSWSDTVTRQRAPSRSSRTSIWRRARRRGAARCRSGSWPRAASGCRPGRRAGAPSMGRPGARRARARLRHRVVHGLVRSSSARSSGWNCRTLLRWITLASLSSWLDQPRQFRRCAARPAGCGAVRRVFLVQRHSICAAARPAACAADARPRR